MENKIKKSWFNVKLYIDGLRQLKIIGIMSAVIMGLGAILVAYGVNLSNANYGVYSYGNRRELIQIGRIVQYDLFELNPFIVATFLVVVPLMTLYLFNYLNRRNACDFYHAIPCTREGIFVTYGAGILTWNIALVFESVIISMIASTVFKYIELNWWTVPVTILNMLAACVFAFGVVAIAMSITGTVFTNVIVSAMILCVPRIFVSVIVYMITSEIQIIPFTFGNSVLNDRLNTVTNFVTGPIIRGEYDAICSYGSFAYTLIIGIIYCAIAMFFMKKRKSEAATSTAISQRLQCFFRLIPAMLICMVPMSLIFEIKIGSGVFDKEDIFLIIVFFIIAIVAYFVYELITTKKLKNIIKAIPGLIWLVVYNIALLVILFAGYNIMLNDVPDVKDVKSVKISYSLYESKDEYFANLLNNVEFTSDNIKELLVSELSRNVNNIKAGTNIYSELLESDVATIDYEDSVYSEYTAIRVEFNCKGPDKVRYIYLTNSASQKLLDMVCNNEQVNESFLKKIDKNDISNALLQKGRSFTLDEIYDLYETYMEELKSYEFSQSFLILQGSNYYENIIIYDSIYLNLKNGQYVRLDIPENMTETVNKYFQMNVANSPDPLTDLLSKTDEIRKIKAEEYESLDGNLYMYIYSIGNQNEDIYVSASTWYGIYDGENLEISDDYTENGERILRQIAKKLEKANGRIDISLDKPIIYVQYSFYQNGVTADGKDAGDRGESGRYYQVDDETIELIRSYGGY